MILLLDIGNTHTHLGFSAGGKLRRTLDVATHSWFAGKGTTDLDQFLAGHRPEAAALCSVVPDATPLAVLAVQQIAKVDPLELTSKTVRGIGIDYPKPQTIGPDRLANALAARHLFGAPAVVVDFGTAVTFDVLDGRGNYVGGIIAPGLNVMTDYLHEKTALLPKIKMRETRAVIGKSTQQAMLIGAVRGYRGLIRELVKALGSELKARRLRVIATGGYAKLIASGLPEITAVRPHLTLEGLQIFLQQ
ncbi:MAG TPA: type III pantothenate kinase [Verrucomicrobiae bacterium]|nr:type III pantothenate kinase [Verrucomicrobiae bacterium]